MGTWGSGNFDSDGALDAKSERSDELWGRIWTALQSKSSTEADECEYDELFVHLEWMLTLETGGCYNGWGMPPVEEFSKVTETWLASWSEYFDGLSGPEFKAERRAVIVDTFDRTRAVCDKYEKMRS